MVPSQSLQFSSLVQQSAGDPRLSIAVLDGPANLSLPCFDSATVSQCHPCEGVAEPQTGRDLDCGTYAASALFGSSSSLQPGLVPECRGVMLPIFNAGASARRSVSVGVLVSALEKAIALKVNIIYVGTGSVEAHLPCGAINEPEVVRLESVLARCEALGIVVVAAINKNDRAPLCHLVNASQILAVRAQVGSLNKTGEPTFLCNALVVCADKIRGASADGGVIEKSGDGVAAILATAALALLACAQLKAGVAPNFQVIRESLLSTACDVEQIVLAKGMPFVMGRIELNAAFEDLKPRVSGVNDLMPGLHVERYGVSGGRRLSVGGFKA